MALSVRSLITISDVKDYYEIKSEAPDINAQIENLINRMSTLFESVAGQPIRRAELVHTQYYDGRGSKLLFTDYTPILTVTSIHDDSEWEWGTSTLIDSDDYRIHSSKKYIVLKVALSSSDQNVKIVYTSGYPEDEIPEDIKQCCIEEVIRKYKHKSDFDVTSKTLPDGSVTYTQKGLMPLTLKTLNKYKQLVVG